MEENRKEKKGLVNDVMKKEKWDEDWRHKKFAGRKKNKNDEMAVGIAATLGFGVALFFTKIWFLVFPLVFVGLIPLLVGITRLLKRKRLPEQVEPRKKPADREKEVLKVAAGHGGNVTVLQIANETSLSIEEARTALDSMVKKGYVQLLVDENGILRYEFPEFSQTMKKDEISRQIEKLSGDE
jgi:hypothetical protein